ncbi:MAG: hypothetical protein KBC00_03390 [Candidatus Levybacteria bacterium]|nr:hypothetical protein [Candidatus Levybacteria bacterium]MBP9815298.1 hypothetical protein [Candidatus Levybacteria bacterium]
MGKHNSYYIFETFLLGIGFFAIYIYSPHVVIETLLIAFLLVCYSGMGILHHYKEHDIHAKIVLEYILISCLVLSIFMLLKSGIV